MKGLLIKDFLLLKNQKQFFIIMVLIALGLGIYSFNESFLISYITIVFSLFTISTISYDEYDNGYAYLFSLPITRTLYVKEKYTLAFLNTIASLLLSSGLASIVALCKYGNIPSELWFTAMTIFPTMLCLLSVMLPLQIRFGAEKGRIASAIMFASIFGIIYLIFSLSAIRTFFTDFIMVLSNYGIYGIVAVIAIIIMIIGYASYRYSLHVIHQKEF